MSTSQEVSPNTSQISNKRTSTNNISSDVLDNVLQQLKDISKNALEYVLLYIASMINDFVSKFLRLMVNKLSSILPNPKSIDESLSDNDKTLMIMNKLLQDEDFRKLWSSFSNRLAQLLKTSFTQINDIVVNEGHQMSNSIQTLIGETLQGTLSSTLQGVLRGLVGVIPLADEILFVVPSAIGKVIPSIMKVFENLSNVLMNISTIMSEITGTDAGIVKSVLDIITKIEQIKDMFTNVLQNTNSALERKNQQLVGTFTPSTTSETSMRGGKKHKSKSHNKSKSKSKSKIKSHSKNKSKSRKKNNKKNKTRKSYHKKY